MKKIIMVILTVRACFALNSGFAQGLTNQIAGKLIDSNQQPIEAATISLIRDKDTIVIKTASSVANGSFIFDNLKQGQYRLIVTSVGFTKYYSGKIAIDARHQHIKLGEIQLKLVSRHSKIVG